MHIEVIRLGLFDLEEFLVNLADVKLSFFGIWDFEMSDVSGSILVWS